MDQQNTGEILSAFPGAAAAPRQARHASALPAVFDACQLGVVLRAVLFVETVLGVAALFVAGDLSAWLSRFMLWTAGALPAALLWLIAGCSLKSVVARWPRVAQYAFGVALGAACGVYAGAMLAMIELERAVAWLAFACCGALFSALLVAALVWRAKGQMPAAAEARLGELQQRIRPHFLFNTLNSAIALVRAEPAQAEALLEDLSDLFREALAEPGLSATLEHEIALARRYLAIENIRFGDRLRLEWAIGAGTGEARLPPLLLQPLVENAVRHGVEPSVDGALVRVSAERRGARVVLKVCNTVPAGQGERGCGMALANVRERLGLLHDLEARFDARLVGGLYQVRIEIPA